MVRWYWNCCDGDNNFTLLKVGGMQLFKMEGPDSTEKILPRTIEVATIIISDLYHTYFTLWFFLLDFWNDNF